ncbi:hypothetical protein PSP31121_05375 [Pandoraea sputorum]|uniref:Type II toxin-antitoxin system RelE/ParE family toxin n=1 Tax=Pandoraea sputorum TaxID=93222 RepID=A0A5E5BKR8_9BURK|nr:hypothetical protein PSP31121_05375 [Pandoraea sputorum]
MRLPAFLAPLNRPGVARTVPALAKAATALLANPRVGAPLCPFALREVRQMLLGAYEVRYEMQDATRYVLRLSQTGEERGYGGGPPSPQ